MERLFLQIININLNISIIILFIIGLRFLLEKAPKKFSYVLWVILLIRLIIPISIETDLNPIPNRFVEYSNGNYIGEVKDSEQITRVSDIGLENKQDREDKELRETPNDFSLNTMENKNLNLNINKIFSYAWIIGTVLFLIHGFNSNRRLKIGLKDSTFLYENIYENEDLETAFIYGVVNPRIYLPRSLSDKERDYIIIHEKAHLKRYDHIIKLLYYMVLCIHWFNPLIWISFILMTRDMELSCDEAVMKELGDSIKEDYAKTLLSLAVANRMDVMAPLSFSENNTKGRIKNILDYKRPGFWISAILIIILVITSFFIFTRPKSGEKIVDSEMVEYTEDKYGLYNKSLKDPRDAAEIIFNIELENIREYTDKDIQLEEARITKFEKVYDYGSYLDSSIDIYTFEYIIKGKELLNYAFVDITEDGAITEENLGVGKPFLAFANIGDRYEFLGFIFAGEFFSTSKAEIEIGLVELLESRGLKEYETFSSNHILSEYRLREGGTWKILLSQPVKKGNSGIWCVDRWMDENGNIYYPIIISDLSLREYYEEIQKKVDQGENKDVLDPKEVAMRLVREDLNFYYAKPYSFKFHDDASIEEFMTYPVNEYYGYIMDIKEYEWSENLFIDLDKVEFLGVENVERLKELDVDPNSLSNGYYIHNPKSYPDSFIIQENTRFFIVDESNNEEKEVNIKEFLKYYEKNKDILFKLEDENFKLKKIISKKKF